MEQDKNNFLIDPETGEKFDIVGKGPIINNTDQTVLAVVEVQPGQIVKRHRKKPSGLNSKEEFVMCYLDEIRLWVEKKENRLTSDEGAFLFFVLPYLDYFGQIILNDDKGQRVRLTVQRAEKLMGWDRNKVNRVLRGLEDKRLIFKVREGQTKFIILNPRLFYRGKANNRQKMIEAFNSNFGDQSA